MPQQFKVTASLDTKPLLAALKKLDKVATANELEAAATEGAYIVQRRAVQIIREKDIIDFGELLGSVVDTDQSVETESATHNLAMKRIGTNVEHGIYNELGTKYMAARPWLRPAFDESRERAQRAMIRYLQRRLAASFGS